ncbi:hypothetical protein [Methylobacterium nonmethylotrophicum]|uniref:Uncharacterized protein n=1 Tax=Methylobacterium nonmethylotrophicum TaxID=1141884 RepID=A0A4Z0NEP3_9HYPH|nr:hypothetical protein [Methylobacterium nonmethylotrophicum]TGD93301.1 hypothetical protein EU555_33470 [Methylobacterium nonmethylotrophicum]
MIGRLISTLRPHRQPDPAETAAAETVPDEAVPDAAVLAAPPEAVAQFPSMVPLTPPPALNDDLEGALCDAVEEALRAAGYLPEPPAG